VYGPRARQPGKLEPFKPCLEERMCAGVWNAHALLRELASNLLAKSIHRLTAPNRLIVPRRIAPPFRTYGITLG